MINAIADIATNKELVDSLNRPRTKIDPHKDLGSVPLLRHISRLSFDLPVTWKGQKISAVGIYARRYTSHEGQTDLWYLEAAKDSGYEGVACVDDTARAVALATKIYTRLIEKYEETQDKEYKKQAEEVKEKAEQWVNFLFYMQEEDGQLRNFILDTKGTKNTISDNSKPGGFPWAARAVWGFALAYKTFGDKKYLDGYMRAFISTSEEMSYVALCILAALEIVSVDETIKYKNKLLTTYITQWADEIMKHFNTYFCHMMKNGSIDNKIYTYAYYELEAMARAGVYLKNETYLKAVQKTIKNFVEPNLAARFYKFFPNEKNSTNLYGVSSIINGLLALTHIVKEKAYPFLETANYYATLALAYSMWMYRENNAGAVMWYPSEGLCLDNTEDDYGGDIYAGTACGAESAIEGGIVQLGLNALRKEDRWLQ